MHQHRYGFGISAYVSNIILVMIVLGALVLVYTQFNAVMSLSDAILSQRLLESEVSMNSLVVVTAAYIDAEDSLHVILSSGAYPATVYGIYVNESLLGNCPAGGHVSLRPYDVAEVVCKLPQEVLVGDVKISYSGGLIEVFASKI